MLKALGATLLIIGLSVCAQTAQARSHHRHYSHHHRSYGSHLNTPHRHVVRLRSARRAHVSRSYHRRPMQRVAAFQSSFAPSRATQSRLVRAAMRHLGSRNFTGRRGPWCGFAMSAFAREAGLPAIRSGRAIDWRKYGRASGARVGAIAVFPHHVGVVTGVVGNKVQIVSGNHGGRVGLGLYSLSRVVAFRAS